MYLSFGYLIAVAQGRRSDDSNAYDGLVMIELAGGHDTAHVMPRLDDESFNEWVEKRPTLSEPYRQLTEDGRWTHNPKKVKAVVDGKLGLTDLLKPLWPLWDEELCGIVAGVGRPDHGRSHFNAKQAAANAVVVGEHSFAKPGWMAQTMHENSCQTNANNVDAIAFGGSGAGSCNTNTGSDQHWSDYRQLSGVATTNSIRDWLAYNYTQAPNTDNHALNDLLTKEQNSMEAMDILQRLVPADWQAQVKAKCPTFPPDSEWGASSGIGKQLKAVAEMMILGTGNTVFNLQQNGYDTHSDEEQRQEDLMEQLTRAVATFIKTSQVCGFSNVLVSTHYEFSRRFAENTNGGTDHGYAGNYLYCSGQRVEKQIVGYNRGTQGFGYDDIMPSYFALNKGDLAKTTDLNDWNACLSNFMGMHAVDYVGTCHDSMKIRNVQLPAKCSAPEASLKNPLQCLSGDASASSNDEKLTSRAFEETVKSMGWAVKNWEALRQDATHSSLVGALREALAIPQPTRQQTVYADIQKRQTSAFPVSRKPDVYYAMEDPKRCVASDAITDPRTCISAAKSVTSWEGRRITTVRYTDAPSGCIHKPADGSVVYNADSGSQNTQGYQSLCIHRAVKTREQDFWYLLERMPYPKNDYTAQERLLRWGLLDYFTITCAATCVTVLKNPEDSSMVIKELQNRVTVFYSPRAPRQSDWNMFILNLPDVAALSKVTVQEMVADWKSTVCPLEVLMVIDYENKTAKMRNPDNRSHEKQLRDCTHFDRLTPAQYGNKLRHMENERYKGIQRSVMSINRYTWWNDFSANSSPEQAVRSRMILSCMNTFAVPYNDVRDGRKMHVYYEKCAKYSDTSFRELAKVMFRDVAVRQSLNQDKSRSTDRCVSWDKPVENYAREFLEVFSVGSDHHTESDVAILSRALNDRCLDEYQVREKQGHPFFESPGKIFSNSRIWRSETQAQSDEIVDTIFDYQPFSDPDVMAAGMFYVKDLFIDFAGVDEPPIEDVKKCAKEMYNHDDDHYHIPTALACVFSSELFKCMVGKKQVWPMAFPIVTSIDLGVPFNARNADNYLRGLGNRCFHQPDVQGFQKSKQWTSNALVNKHKLESSWVARRLSAKLGGASFRTRSAFEAAYAHYQLQDGNGTMTGSYGVHSAICSSHWYDIAGASQGREAVSADFLFSGARAVNNARKRRNAMRNVVTTGIQNDCNILS